MKKIEVYHFFSSAVKEDSKSSAAMRRVSVV
jgi:hypothetical protein